MSFRNLSKTKMLMFVPLIALVLFAAGCDDDDNPVVPTIKTSIAGSAHLEFGVSGDLHNSVVSLYLSKEAFIARTPILTGGTSGFGASVDFNIPNVVPGNYYLDVWRDNDNSGTRNAGDYVGIFGIPGGVSEDFLIQFQIHEGEEKFMSIPMYILTN